VVPVLRAAVDHEEAVVDRNEKIMIYTRKRSIGR